MKNQSKSLTTIVSKIVIHDILLAPTLFAKTNAGRYCASASDGSVEITQAIVIGLQRGCSDQWKSMPEQHWK